MITLVETLIAIKDIGKKVIKSKSVSSSTSAFGVLVSSMACSKTVLKAAVTPNPWCKVLYGASAGLNGISTLAHGVSAYYGVSTRTSGTALGTYGLGYVCSLLGNACQKAADLSDPAANLTEGFFEEVIKKAV